MQDAPFFTVKLGIKMLPCTVMFRNGVVVGQILGFDGLGGVDDFATSALEDCLQQAEVWYAHRCTHMHTNPGRTFTSQEPTLLK